jgi:hypothetical protein
VVPPPPPSPSHTYQAIITPPERVAWPSHVDDPAEVPAGDKPPMWLSPADAVVALEQASWPSSAANADDVEEAIATPRPVVLRVPPADKPVVLRPEQEPWPSHTEDVDPGAIGVAAAKPPLWLSPADAAVALPPERELWPAHGEDADPGATAIAGARPPEAAEPSPSQTLRAVVPPAPPSRPIDLVLPPSGLPEDLFGEPGATPVTAAKPRRARTVPPTEKIKPRARPGSGAAKPAAPRQRGTALWLLLLMIALGAAAMATAYFWPSGL